MIRAAWRPIVIVCLAALLTGSAVACLADEDDKAPRLIVTADFNRDGIADIAEVVVAAHDPAASDSAPRMLSILLGNGDGTFRSAASSAALGRDPQSMVVGDFNGDGVPDLIVGDADGSLLELVGDGSGHLLPAREIAHLGSVSSIAVADFNRDGTLDIAVSDSRSSVVTVLIGVGNGLGKAGSENAETAGRFRQVWSFQLPQRGKLFHLAAADFNHDGLPDLAVTNDDDPSYQVMLNNGNGTFTYAPQLSKVVDPNAHCAT